MPRRIAARNGAIGRRALGALAGLGLLAIALAGCGSSGPARATTTITLYNGQHPETTDALVSAFEKRTGIAVSVRSDDEDTLDAQIVAEGSRSPADVFYTENSPALEYLQARGLLAPLPRATLAATPPRYDSPDGDWVGVSARVSVLVYNPRLIAASALPTRVLELADPRYRGELAIAPGETDFQPIVTAVLRAYGKARTLTWLKGVKANGAAHSYPDNETITSEVNRGAVAFGLINQYYWYRLRAEIGAANIHSKLAFFAPHDPGYVVDVSGVGVLASSRHRAAAERFVAFLVSAAGQRIIASSTSFEYPIASGVTKRPGEVPFSSLRPYPISVAQLGTGQTAVSLLHEVELL